MSTATRQQTRTTTTTEASGILDKILAASDGVDAIASRYREQADDPNIGRLKRAMLLADAVAALDRAITPDMMGQIMRLMNTRLGFKTDRTGDGGKPPYDATVVKRCVIDGLLRGVFPVGNEMNIIAGECYVTQEGYTRLVSEIPGLTDLDPVPGVPTVKDGVTACRVAVRWKLRGKPDSLKGADGSEGRVFPIISYQSSSADNIMGKAKRKALAAVHFLLTKSEQSNKDSVSDIPEAGGVNGATPMAAAAKGAAALAAKLDPQNQAASAPTDEQLHDQRIPGVDED